MINDWPEVKTDCEEICEEILQWLYILLQEIVFDKDVIQYMKQILSPSTSAF
jgi:hypothetical protein